MMDNYCDDMSAEEMARKFEEIKKQTIFPKKIHNVQMMVTIVGRYYGNPFKACSAKKNVKKRTFIGVRTAYAFLSF